jgi:hypothetical protein
MIAEFDGEGHFKTFTGERNPSFSANCNALVALLYTPDPDVYIDQVSKTVSFLCEAWWEGAINDKWVGTSISQLRPNEWLNTGSEGGVRIPILHKQSANQRQNFSHQYPMMLLSQALTRLLRLWDAGRLRACPTDLIRDKVPVVLCQILVQTCRSQDPDGSWGDRSNEVTAYSILTLNYLAPLPWTIALLPEIHQAIASGRRFLGEAVEKWDQPDIIWIEKVSYGSTVLCRTYCLAAMKSSISAEPWREAVQQLTNVPLKSVEKFLYFFSKLPLFSQMPKWQLRAALVEGYLFLSKLKQDSTFIFPKIKQTDEKYLEYIPFTWTASNYLQKTPLSANLIWEMMVVSMLNYQADEYMEAVVGKCFETNLSPIREIIHELCAPPNTETNGSKKRSFTEITEAPTKEENTNGNSSLSDVKQVLSRFITYILTHPKTTNSSPYDFSRLRSELQTFLLAHVIHISDNARFTQQENHSADLTAPFLTPRTSYFSWVRTTSAEHTSCAYSFAFISCLTGVKGKDCFSSVRAKYFAQDLCTHLAVMCRQYNDFGSIARDRTERNINSINFPEFHDEEGKVDEKKLKAELFEIAEYERECLKLATSKLEEKVPQMVLIVFRLFVDVTDLYGQIYVARDIGVANQTQSKKTAS